MPSIIDALVYGVLAALMITFVAATGLARAQRPGWAVLPPMMFARTKLFRAGCLVLVSILIFSCCLWLIWPRPQSCPDRTLIQVGMTPDEVRAKLDDPKKVDVGSEGEFWYYDCPWWNLSPPIDVYFGKDCRVKYVYIAD